MQTLYILATRDENDQASPQKVLKSQFAASKSLFAFLLQNVVEIAKYAEKDAYKKANKYIPSANDLNINTKLAGSNMLWQVLEDYKYINLIKNEKSDSLIDLELVKKIYIKLTLSAEYHHYIKIQQQSKQEDRKIFEFILNDLMLANEEFVQMAEDHFANWNDDGEMLAQLLLQYFVKPLSFDFNKFIDLEKEQFAITLLNSVIEKDAHLQGFITPKLNNWDPDRIAHLDMVILKMGIAEFLYFETIPPKVTINEYIDIAKEYSTAQSGNFINGTLDNIHKDLLESDQLKKIQYKKH